MEINPLKSSLLKKKEKKRIMLHTAGRKILWMERTGGVVIDGKDDIIMPAIKSSPWSFAVAQARCHPCAEDARIKGCYLL